MTDMQDLLSRTTLKAVGTFLRSDENVLERMLREDVTPGAYMEGRRDNLKVALRRAKAAESGEVAEAVRELEDAAESIGFYAGLKAGARLVLALTDGGELVC